MTAADEHGNAAVVVHSNSFPQFGSGVVLDDGLVLTNRPGRGFDLQAPPGAANAPAAGKVPKTTLHAWALDRGDTLLLGATPGGVNQLPWNAQMLTELIGGASIVDAVCNPRWALNDEDVLAVEEGARIGATPADKVVPPLSHRSAQQIVQIGRDGLIDAAADPRVAARALAAY